MLRQICLGLCLASLFVGITSAQNIETSPLSRYGYGLLQNPSSVTNKAMGGVGISLRDDYAINFANPAALAALDSLHFVLDVGLTGQYAFLKGADNTKKTFEGSLDYIAIKFPLFKVIGFSTGIKPFSRTGYQMTKISSVEGFKEVEQTETYSGSGSMQELFFSIGTNIYKGLSFGIEANYLFGETAHNVLTSYNASVINKAYFSDALKASTWSVSTGLQYHHRLNKLDYIVLGATYTPKLKSSLIRNYVYNKNYGDISKPDLEAEQLKLNTELPMSIGAGLSYGHENKLIAAFDVKYTKWGSVPNAFSYQDITMKDAYRFALGASYMRDPFSRYFQDRLIYRAGINFSNGYFEHNKFGRTSTLGLAMGFGIPIYVTNERPSYLNLSLEYEKSFSSNALMIKQDILKLSFSINFNETWFRKLKIY